MFGLVPRREAILYYLYMMSDGEISYDEEKLFNEICKELKLNESDKETVIAEANKIVSDSSSIISAIKDNKFDPDDIFSLFRKSSFAIKIWNLEMKKK